ncbi:MAG: hypothetical protein NVS9B12_14500 [Vulcanimicrobiaceae bacterium]
MVWALAGLVLSAAAGAFALRASRRTDAFYAREVYGMGPRSHRRFAALCGAFAGLFVLGTAWPLVPPVPVFALFALALILYGSSFLRGYADEDS